MVQRAGKLCGWTVHDLERRRPHRICRTPCPSAVAFDLGARRYLYARGAQVFEGHGARPDFTALPDPPVGAEGIAQVWIGADGAVHLAHLQPVKKDALLTKGETTYYLFEGTRIALVDDVDYFGGMAIELKLVDGRWHRLDAVPSFGGPDNAATVAAIESRALAAGSVAAHLHAAATPRLPTAVEAEPVAGSPAAAALLRKAYPGTEDRVEVLAFGRASGLLVYPTYLGHVGPVYLCRQGCARSTRIFERRDDGVMCGVFLSHQGSFAWVSRDRDLVVFDDRPTLTPVLRLRSRESRFGEAMEAWVPIPEGFKGP